MEWYLHVVKNYAAFSGRARRAEYWYFVLFNVIISLGLMILDAVTGTFDPDMGYGLLTSLYTLAVLVPTLAVTVRRLHDTGRSGWWVLIGLIPLVGGVVLLIFMVLDGAPSENQFGPNPKVVA